MNHRTGLDRSQTLLFPEWLEDYVEVQVAEGAGRTSLWDDQAMVWVHALSAQGTGESTDGVEPDNAGVQPQTSLKSGELREIDGGGGSKSPAKSLNRGGGPFFPFVGEVILPDGYPYEPNLWKTKTGDLNFRTAGQTFSPPITRPALEFSHSLAIC